MSDEPSAEIQSEDAGIRFDLVLGILGAVVGAVLGHILFLVIVKSGFYAMMLPGALAGFGCGAWLKKESKGMGVFVALVGLAAGLYTEWKVFPFIADNSFGYFLSHLHQLKPVSMIMIGLGAAFGYWFGKGRDR